MFAQSAVKLMHNVGFGELDIDWGVIFSLPFHCLPFTPADSIQYPKKEVSAKDMVALLKEVRGVCTTLTHRHRQTPIYALFYFLESTKMNNQGLVKSGSNGKHFPLTITCTAGEAKYKHLLIGEMGQYIDLCQLMAYNFSGEWEKVADHTAVLFRNASDPNTTPAIADKGCQVLHQQGCTSQRDCPWYAALWRFLCQHYGARSSFFKCWNRHG
ncbi:uncharacterized protein BDW43DRAFT_178098 [Aspergillus alliaceus]|uniref:uncharacterized protein n=1 Tax=Petromyces alliaceus TaxID=209559 RepID=UPI0012A6F32B|nr:uncharacterized protein BDW43DRAFT_178098 [Aspergillus alliaceus]KAB8229805.1 hypothetical protein BDW43DRAFT_178098 [Aspergillus alliaceus]